MIGLEGDEETVGVEVGEVVEGVRRAAGGECEGLFSADASDSGVDSEWICGGLMKNRSMKRTIDSMAAAPRMRPLGIHPMMRRTARRRGHGGEMSKR